MRGLIPVAPALHRAAAPEPLTWHKGRVLHQSTAYAIYWSPPGFPMPADYVATTNQYFQDQQASSTGSSYAVVSQYSDTQGPAGTSSTFGGALVQNDPAASECTDVPVVDLKVAITLCLKASTVESFIERIAAARGLASPNAIFFLFLPPGTGICSDDGRTCSYAQFAAYHGWTRGGTIYAVLPWFDTPRLGSIAHEHIEAITDPDGGGWFTSDQDEIADICQIAGDSQQTLGSTQYSLPLEWSNADGRCSDKTPPATSPLLLRARGKGVGDVTATFAGQQLTCGVTGGIGDCVTVVRQGARVALSAAPGDDSVFGSWDRLTPCTLKTRARCTFTSGAGRATVTASFVGDASGMFLLSVDVKGRGAVVMPSGKRCRTSCVQTVQGGKAITLRAVPDKGWRLRTMRDDTRTCGTKLRCTLRLHDSNNVFATFVRK